MFDLDAFEQDLKDFYDDEDTSWLYVDAVLSLAGMVEYYGILMVA